MAGKPPLAQGSTSDLLIQHFTHQHPLREIYNAEKFNCDGCNTLGFGTRFRCSSCDFDLHQRCAESPFILSSPLHPPHQLTLVNVPGKQHFCNICGGTTNGLLYTCQECDFDVHPLCTETPLTAHHAPHPHHLLTLQPGNPAGICGGCGGAGSGSSWWYRCGVCNVDVHRECVVQAAAQAQYNGYAGGVNYQQPVNNQGYYGGVGGNGYGREKSVWPIVGKFALYFLIECIHSNADNTRRKRKKKAAEEAQRAEMEAQWYEEERVRRNRDDGW